MITGLVSTGFTPSSFTGCVLHTIVFSVVAITDGGGEGIGGTPPLRFTLIGVFSDGTTESCAPALSPAGATSLGCGCGCESSDACAVVICGTSIGAGSGFGIVG